MKLLTHTKPKRDCLEEPINVYKFSKVTDEIITSNNSGCEYCSDLYSQNVGLRNELQRLQEVMQQMKADFNQTITFQNESYGNLNYRYKIVMEKILPILLKIDNQQDNTDTE